MNKESKTPAKVQPIEQFRQISDMKSSVWNNRRHLLDTDDITMAELDVLVKTARLCKEIMLDPVRPCNLLSSQNIALLFYENSTRTTTSFELAAKRLGASVQKLDIQSSSVAKGETIIDTARTVVSMGVKLIVQRHSVSGSAALVASTLGDQVQVVNAGDGWNAHPSQALLDYFTMTEVAGPLENKKVAIIGDIAHSRVARSNIRLLNKLGTDIHIAAPPTLLPAHADSLGATVHETIEPAITNADFIMVLRLQLERQKQGLIPSLSEYQRVYRLDRARLTMAKTNVKVMHPGPVNRDVEITHDLVDDTNISLVSTQVTNGVAVRMAILYLLLQQEVSTHV